MKIVEILSIGKRIRILVRYHLIGLYLLRLTALATSPKPHHTPMLHLLGGL